MSRQSLEHFDVCVVGAGVVGLAVARECALRGESVLVVERHPRIGSEISSRNSEVIHAGIYYPQDSLKTRLCVDGRERLYRYCEKMNVAHRRTGKFIVAVEAQQLSALGQLQRQALVNGVADLEAVEGQDLSRWEPEVSAVAALYSPSSGIVDGHQLMIAMLGDIERHGGLLALRTEFDEAQTSAEGFLVSVNSMNEAYRFHCSRLVNAAGLGAQSVAHRVEGGAPASVPPLYWCKGSYFDLAGKSPFRHLIYPLPETNTTGLGVHATLDLAGQVRFGPDIEYIDRMDYRVPESKREQFAAAIRQYYPGLQERHLQPAYAGIRPKLQRPGEAARDFVIQHESEGLVHLFGIESPGLTASLSIADYVRRLLGV